jgi:GcrA cell cycle regulator
MSARAVDWTAENVEILKLGVAAGDSYSLIAKRIPNCTRCSAIGKAQRIGVRQPAKPAAPRAGSAVPKAPMVRRYSHPTWSMTATPATPRPAPASIRVGEEPSGLRDVLTIGRGECRWPIGDPQTATFTLCGCAAPEGPYCEDHRKRAFTSDATRKWVDRKLAMPARGPFS